MKNEPNNQTTKKRTKSLDLQQKNKSTITTTNNTLIPPVNLTSTTLQPAIGNSTGNATDQTVIISANTPSLKLSGETAEPQASKLPQNTLENTSLLQYSKGSGAVRCREILKG